MQQADELALVAVPDRVAAVLMAADHREDVRQRRVVLEVDQVFAGVGPVDHLQFAQLHRRGQHAHALVAGVLGAAGVEDQLQFVAAVVMLVVRAGLALAGDLEDGVGAGVEQPDRRVHQPVERYSGTAVHSDSSSGLRIAQDLGASSPTTMCR